MSDDKEEKLVERRKMYTSTEIDQIVARAVQNHDISLLKASIKTIEDTHERQHREIKRSFETLYERFDKKFEQLNKHTDQCREDLEKDIERRFATKPEVEALRGEIKSLWGKIIAGVSVAVVLINIGFNWWNAVTRDEHHDNEPPPIQYKSE